MTEELGSGICAREYRQHSHPARPSPWLSLEAASVAVCKGRAQCLQQHSHPSEALGMQNTPPKAHTPLTHLGWDLDLGSAAGKPLDHVKSLPCPVFLLLGNGRSILALLVSPYRTDSPSFTSLTHLA